MGLTSEDVPLSPLEGLVDDGEVPVEFCRLGDAVSRVHGPERGVSDLAVRALAGAHRTGYVWTDAAGGSGPPEDVVPERP